MAYVIRKMLVLGLAVWGAAAAVGAQTWVAIGFEKTPSRNVLRELEKQLNVRPEVDGAAFRFAFRSAGRTDWTGRLVLVDVRGVCEVPRTPEPWTAKPLGWVDTVDGDWLPFVHVDCKRLADAVRRSLPANDAVTDGPMARAIAMVIRHELTHLTRRTGQHDHTREFSAALKL